MPQIRPYMERIAQFKRRLVERALRRHGGRVKVAAAMLGMTHNHLSVLMYRLRLKSREFKPSEGQELPAELRRDHSTRQPPPVERMIGTSVAYYRRKRKKEEAPT